MEREVKRILNLLIESMELNPYWETTSCAATQEFPKVSGTRKFITVLTAPATGFYP
jgi:hypothetical protein